MAEDNETDDWVVGSTIRASAENLTLFHGMSFPLDPSRLPDPPADPNVA